MTYKPQPKPYQQFTSLKLLGKLPRTSSIVCKWARGERHEHIECMVIADDCLHRKMNLSQIAWPVWHVRRNKFQHTSSQLRVRQKVKPRQGKRLDAKLLGFDDLVGRYWG